MTEPSPGMVAFLAAKIVSSDVAAANDQQDREALLRHAAMRVQLEIDASGGKLLSAGGGQLLVVYERPSAAALAAMALVAAFPFGSRGADGPAVDIHLALHTGPAAQTRDAVSGPVLAYLGQVLFVSKPGQILVSDPMAALLRMAQDELPPEVDIRGVGLLNLRDGSDPTRVFRIDIIDTAATAPADVAIQPPPIPIRRKRPASQAPPRRRAGVDPEQFRVYTLGRFQVERGGVAVELANSQAFKGLQLFKCLLSRPSRRIPRDQAYELFWPESPKGKVNTTFRTNIKRLRDLLEPDVDHQASILQYTLEIVSIRTEPPIWVDADEFERLIQEARHTESPDALLEEADRLWEGEYLPDDLYHDWAAPRRAELGRLWTELQFELARRREQRGDEHGAEAALQKLLAADPTDEQAARELMLLHGHHGRRSDALKVYQRLEEALGRELRMEPAAETQAVRHRVAAGEIEQAPAPERAAGLVPFPWPASPQAGPPTSSPDGQQPPARPDGSTSLEPRSQTVQPTTPMAPREPFGTASRPDSPTTWPTLPPDPAEAESFTPTYPFPTPDSLIGRQADLYAARQSLTRGLTEGQTLLIGAPAGAGKSALAGLILAEARALGYLCLAGGSFDQDSPSPYAPIRDALCDYLLAQQPELLRAELGHLVTDLMPIVPELRYHLNNTGELPTTAPDQARLLAAVHGCFRVLAMRTPTLLCLEDLHAADGATLEMLQYLARQTRRLRLVIVGTFRPEEVKPGRPLDRLLSASRRDGSAQVIVLSQLNRDETQALIADRLNGAVSDVLTDALFTVTEGNPLFIEQLVLALREELGIVQRDGVWYRVGGESASTPALPPIVESVIERRFDRLPPGGRDTLAMAAVLGQTFELSTLLAALPPADAELAVGVLDNAISAQLLRDTATGYRFGHAMIREALYRRLSGPRRAMLHARAGAVIEEAAGERADERAAELAHHYGLAVTVAPTAEKALQFCLLAGRRSAALSAHRDALRHYTRAYELLAARGAQDGLSREAQEAQQIEVLQGRGTAEHDVGLWQDAISTFRQVLSLTNDPYRQALAYRAIGRGLEQVSGMTGALAAYDDALSILESVADQTDAMPLRLALLYDKSFPYLVQGRFAPVLEAGQQILAAGAESGDGMLVFRGNGLMALAHMWMGQVEEAVPHYTQALQAVQLGGNKLQIATAYENYGTQLYMAGRFEEARVHIEQAAAFYRDAAGERRTVLACQRLSRIYLAMGQLDRALEQAERGRILALEVGDRHAAECNAALGAVYLAQSAWSHATACFERALEVQHRVGHLVSTTDSLLGLGLVHERLGDWAAAERHYRQAVSIAETMDVGVRTVAPARQLGRLLHRMGQREAATQEIARGISVAEGMPLTLELAPTLLVRAELRQQQDLPGALLDVERARSAPMVAEVAVEAGARMVALSLAAGQVDTAARALVDVQATATQLGTPYGLGLAALSAGRLAAAQGSHESARAACESALERFTEAAMPYERALTLQQLADTLQQSGSVSDAGAELRAQASQLLSGLLSDPSERQDKTGAA